MRPAICPLVTSYAGSPHPVAHFTAARLSRTPGCSPIASWTEALGLTGRGAALSDVRHGGSTRHVLTGLLRQSIYGRLAGYKDVNYAKRLARLPTHQTPGTIDVIPRACGGMRSDSHRRRRATGIPGPSMRSGARALGPSAPHSCATNRCNADATRAHREGLAPLARARYRRDGRMRERERPRRPTPDREIRRPRHI